MSIYLGDLVAFLVLMQNGKGLLSKAPYYIKEKVQLLESSGSRLYLEGNLDLNNLSIWQQWFDMWKADPNDKVVF